MNSVFAQYPEFVASGVLDMLVGPQEHHKAKFQAVLKVITKKVRRFMKGRERAFEIERWLNTELVLSVERTNIDTGIINIDTSIGSRTLFTVEWDDSVLHGPETILVEYRRGGKIETYQYFTPSDAELVIIQQEMLDAIEAGHQDYYGPYDDVIYHDTVEELYEAMLEENKRYQTRNERQLLANA